MAAARQAVGRSQNSGVRRSVIRRAGGERTFNSNAIGVGEMVNPAFIAAHADGVAVLTHCCATVVPSLRRRDVLSAERQDYSS